MRQPWNRRTHIYDYFTDKWYKAPKGAKLIRRWIELYPPPENSDITWMWMKVKQVNQVEHVRGLVRKMKDYIKNP